MKLVCWEELPGPGSPAAIKVCTRRGRTGKAMSECEWRKLEGDVAIEIEQGEQNLKLRDFKRGERECVNLLTTCQGQFQFP